MSQSRQILTSYQNFDNQQLIAQVNPSPRVCLDFSYLVSANVVAPVKIKICQLEEVLCTPSVSSYLGNPFLEEAVLSDPQEYRVQVELRSGGPKGKHLFLPITSTYSVEIEYDSFTRICKHKWEECLQTVYRLCDLPFDATFCFSVIRMCEPNHQIILGTCSLSLFDNSGMLRRGSYRLPLVLINDKSSSGNGRHISMDTLSDLLASLDLERRLKLIELGEIEAVESQDSLARIELARLQETVLIATRCPFLKIELPLFDLPVVYSEALEILAAPRSAFDPEIDSYNLVESMHRSLARNHRKEMIDRDLKPNSKTRDELHKIISFPITKSLTADEKDILWNYRYYLSREKKALIKFIRAVLWSDAREVREAIDLIHDWATPDIGDVLELLRPEFEDLEVRSYAVEQLSKADDTELSLYLLQLVQSLQVDYDIIKLSKVRMNYKYQLFDFLSQRALKSEFLGILFYWYIWTEAKSGIHHKIYNKLLRIFLRRLSKDPNGKSRNKVFTRQCRLVSQFAEISKVVKLSKESASKKLESLKKMLGDPKRELCDFPPLPLPLDPSIVVIGINIDDTRIFKSTQAPIKITFKRQNGGEYPVIFKQGDDLRQDQLVIQTINLMDRLLRKENLDLKLTPYKVLATGPDQGFFQFIDSIALADVLAQDISVVSYLKKQSNGNTINHQNIMDSYLRSCAGYCVITHLLGVGDRHLDNLMLTKDGRMFHIDFGFILGRDPKPFPPPMKLCKEMVEAMGGVQSELYVDFKNYCYVSYSILRKSSNLIINLFSLMTLGELSVDPEKVVTTLLDKFRPELSDESATVHFGSLISDSVNAMFPVVIDAIHKWAQYWLR